MERPSATALERRCPRPRVRKRRGGADRARDGVVVDLSRKRVLLDNNAANLTYKEFELLQYLVLREGRTIERAELISSLWSAGDDEVPNERTIDVHVRRLRETVQALRKRGITHVIECGPGRVLAGMVKRIDGDLVSGAIFDPASLNDVKGLLA